MRVGYILFLLITFLLVFSLSSLADSDFTVKIIKNEVSVGNIASFEIMITNNRDVQQRYSIYSLQTVQGWSVDTFPLKDKIVELAPGRSKTVEIRAQTLEDFPPGIYYIPITISGDQGDETQKALKVYLSSEEPVDYLPTIKVTVDVNEKISPKVAVPIKLFIENRNPLNLTNLQIKIQSDIPEFVKQTTVNILPLEKKTVEFTITPNEFQQPKEYVLFFVFERNGQTVKVVEQQIEIISLLPDFFLELDSETVFLKTFYLITATNDGNVLNTQDVKIPVSLWHSLFAKSDAQVVKEDGQHYLIWSTSLGPNESIAYNYVANYRLLLYILIITIIFTLFYFYVRSPLTINKSAIAARISEEEGTLSEIKVTLDVKNKRKKLLKNISVIDIIPGIANIEKSLELGTLKPKEIKRTKKGTKVIWSLAELDGHENRLITYKVRAKLNIVGTFSLPRVTLEYEVGRGKKKKAYSNTFRLSA